MRYGEKDVHNRTEKAGIHYKGRSLEHRRDEDKYSKSFLINSIYLTKNLVASPATSWCRSCEEKRFFEEKCLEFLIKKRKHINITT